MTAQKLPGTDAARHGTGDADLTIMLAAHDAFRRDLTRLARAAGTLGHEERDGLPLIGTALSSGEWRAVGRKIARKNGLADGSEMFAWMLDGTDRQHTAAILASLPPPLRLLYRTVWKPRFDKKPRW